MARPKNPNAFCTEEACGKPSYCRGLCRYHYHSGYGKGTLSLIPVPKTCSREDCARKHFCKGLCQYHYNRQYEGHTPEPRPKKRTCSVDGCGKPYRGNGLCREHKQQAWQKANPAKVVAYTRIRETRKTQAGGSYTGEEWQAILDCYGHRCRNCASEGKLTVDHIVPVSKGGSSHHWNLAPLCGSCNSKKRAKVNFY